jgi:hypothetical protein
MVSYTEWTRIGHEVYKAKGGTYTGEGSATDVTETLAEFWQQNTGRLRSASSSEARQIAEQNMAV